MCGHQNDDVDLHLISIYSSSAIYIAYIILDPREKQTNRTKCAPPGTLMELIL